MHAGKMAHPVPELIRQRTMPVHRHQHSRRRRRFHYHPDALGPDADWWPPISLDRHKLTARKGLAALAIVALSVSLPMAGLQIFVWFFGAERARQWLIENSLDSLAHFMR